MRATKSFRLPSREKQKNDDDDEREKLFSCLTFPPPSSFSSHVRGNRRQEHDPENHKDKTQQRSQERDGMGARKEKVDDQKAGLLQEGKRKEEKRKGNTKEGKE